MGSRRDQTLAFLKAAAGPVTIAQVAAHLDAHLNTARFHLTSLVNDGLAELTQPDTAAPGRGRPTAHYQATQGMDPTGPTNTALLVDIALSGLKTHPNPTDAAYQLGHQWASNRTVSVQRDAITYVTDALHQFGFAPRTAAIPNQPGRYEFTLTHCPFLPLLAEHADVICPMHHGILHGTAQNADPDAVVESFTPFATPATCTARLHTPSMKDGPSC